MSKPARAKSHPITVLDVHERVCGLESRMTSMEGKVDTSLSLLTELVRGQQVIGVEEQKTERVRLGSRARMVVSLFTALGAILGGGVVAGILHACS